MSVTDYGVWGTLNDALAGPAEPEFVEYFNSLLQPNARVFEVGIGSGRLALPLAKSGFRVSGIDTSQRMLQLLAENDPDQLISYSTGDITEDRNFGRFDAVLLAYNVLSMLPNREAQERGLRNACRHLASNGFLIIENVTPHAITSQLNERRQAIGVQFHDDELWLNLSRYYPEEQRYKARFLALETGGFVERSGDLTLIEATTVCDLVTSQGLDLIRQADSWAGHQFSNDSASYILTFQRCADATGGSKKPAPTSRQGR